MSHSSSGTSSVIGQIENARFNTRLVTVDDEMRYSNYLMSRFFCPYTVDAEKFETSLENVLVDNLDDTKVADSPSENKEPEPVEQRNTCKKKSKQTKALQKTENSNESFTAPVVDSQSPVLETSNLNLETSTSSKLEDVADVSPPSSALVPGQLNGGLPLSETKESTYSKAESSSPQKNTESDDTNLNKSKQNSKTKVLRCKIHSDVE
mgnify:CR=1 FL=1